MSKTNDTKICKKNMSFDECEMAILKNAIDESEKIQGEKILNNIETKKIIKILEDFLVDTKLICYGGTAINNILPKSVQFYNKSITIPDYDFFSANALDDAKKLSDLYYKKGYKNIVAKSGMHFGTYKIYVNFIPIADITYLYEPIFKAIQRDSIKISGIYYAPPNFLRMSMFLELSRPFGDVSRWEKVLSRLTLLNKYYPLNQKIECKKIHFNEENSLSW